MDPMRYRDQLDGAVVEALTGVSAKMDEVMNAVSSQGQTIASSQRAILELSQRQINLERRVDGVEAMARENVRRRKTDTPMYLALQIARDLALIVAILFVGWGLSQIAATLAEMLNR